MEFTEMDSTDRNILDIIKDEARLSYSEIGARLGISRVAVKNHMDAMEKKGIITGYKTIIDTGNISGGMEFYLDLEVIPEQFHNIVTFLNKSSLIRKMYTVSGECKIHAEGICTDMKLINRLSTNLYNMYGTRRVGVHMILDTLKDVDGGVFYEGQETKQDEEH